jgi:hypothetical protein
MAVFILAVVGRVDSASAQIPPPASSTVRVAGIVLKWVRGDKETNLRRLEPMVREAVKGGARTVVTTECFLDGYAIQDKSKPGSNATTGRGTALTQAGRLNEGRGRIQPPQQQHQAVGQQAGDAGWAIK